jgi:serine/threonine protein phosphatase PrpC
MFFILLEVGDVDIDRVPSEDYNHPNGWSIGSVFDGHGGYNVSEYASIHLIPTLIRNISVLGIYLSFYLSN